VALIVHNIEVRFMRKLGSVAVGVAVSVALMLGSRPSSAFDVGVSINIAPPELPVYEQPDCPGDGYIWTPGYWAWGDNDYYWVPGTWVEAPEPGYLWTPGYWGWQDGAYLWHGGYWGTQIGFYGGVDYGFGYFGHGYDGGYWDSGHFRYNRAYNNVRNTHITNVYTRTTVNHITVNHISFNGGNGGIHARADQRELGAEHERHLSPVAAQTRQEQVAHGNPDLRVSANHGHPAIAATARSGEFSGHGVIAAHGAPPAATTHFQTEQHGAGYAPGRAVTPQQPQHEFTAPRENRENVAPPRESTPPREQGRVENIPQRPVTPPAATSHFQPEQHGAGYAPGRAITPQQPQHEFTAPRENRDNVAPPRESTPPREQSRIENIPQRPVTPQVQQHAPTPPPQTAHPPATHNEPEHHEEQHEH
jgi:WXXGXW repeat (2 copies)